MIKLLETLGAKDKPVFIINYNWVTMPKTMYEKLLNDNLIPVIIDNGSTYQPTIDWYEEIKDNVIVTPDNILKDHRVFWNMNLNSYFKCENFAVTDPDLDISELPEDWFEVCSDALKYSPGVIKKVGPGLSLEGLPVESAFHEYLDGRDLSTPDKWEACNWTQHFNEYSYVAGLDTTLAVYSKTRETLGDAYFLSALRMKPPYICKHIPWYFGFNNINDEIINFINTANSASNMAKFAKAKAQQLNLDIFK